MNKRVSIQKIAAWILVANIALITHNSLAMFTVLKKPALRPVKTISYTQRKSSTYPFILSEPCYMALIKQNKKNKEKLRMLKNNPDANIREIWQLEDKIKKDSRMIISSKLHKTSDEIAE